MMAEEDEGQEEAPVTAALFIDRAIGELATLASKETGRYAFDAVHFCERDGDFVAVVTDGRRLAILPLPEPPDGVRSELSGPLDVPAEVIISRFKGTPKSPRKELDGLKISKIDGDNKITLTGLGGAGSLVRSEMDLPDVEFPDIDQVLPKDEPVFTIRFNLNQLMEICEVLGNVRLKKDYTPTAEFEFFGPAAAARITIDADRNTKRKATVLLMPVVSEED